MAPSTWLAAIQDRLADKHPGRQVIARALLAGIAISVLLLILGGLAAWADTKPPSPSIALFEVAATPERFEKLGALLPGDDLRSLQSPLLADFAFILAYTATLSLLVLSLGPWGYRISALTGRARQLAWMVVVAAGLDVTENALLLWQIHQDTHSGWALAVTAAAAWAKLLLIAVAVVYIAGAVAGFVVRPGWIPPPGARAWTGVPVTVPPKADPTRRVLALSGGGVRSGTFALGVLQRLDRGTGTGRSTDLRWGDVDQVTAVSGGAYMAGAWQIARPPHESAAAQDAELQGAPPLPWARTVPDGVGPEELHLRVNLGYLLDPAPAAAEGTGGSGSGQSGTIAVGGGRSRQFPQPTPRGPAGGVATMVTGLLVNLGVLFAALVVVAVPVGWLSGSELVAPMAQPGTTTPAEVDWGRLVAPVVVWIGFAVAFLVLWVGGRRLASTKVRWVAGLGSWAERYSWALGRVAIAITLALATLLLLVPWALHDLAALEGFAATVTWVQALTATAFVGTVIKTLSSLAKAGPLKPWITRMGGVLLALIAAVVGGWFARSAAIAGPGNLPGPGWLSDPRAQGLILLGLVVGYALANPEWWAPASFYRGRLRLAYALRREPGSSTRPVRIRPWNGSDEPLLADYATADDPEPTQSEPAADAADVRRDPRLVICTAANVSDRSEHTVYGIPAWSLTLTPSEVCLSRPVLGGPGAQQNRVATRWVERLWTRPDNPRLTVMAAVAMSGAAVAPGSGRFSKGSTNSFLALLNVRLGVWLPNPRHAAVYADAPRHYRYSEDAPDSAQGGAVEPTGSAWPEFPRVRISYLLKELFGIFDPDDPYLYVTDGGHWENSAVVEQLREQSVLELVAVDGSGATAGKMGTLADAMMLLYEEVGAQLQLDFSAFRTDSAGLARATGLGVIRYREAGQIGLLWYLRPAITATVPALAAAYAEQNPGFPNEPTLDQFFSDLQFEAYRVMGDHVATIMLKGRERLLATLSDSASLRAFRTAAEGDDEDLWAVRDLAACLGDDEVQAYRALKASLAPAPTDRPAQGDDGSA